MNRQIWKVEFHCKKQGITLDNNVGHQTIPDVLLSDQWNSGIDWKMLRFQRCGGHCKLGRFLAADHKWMWVPLFLSHSNLSGFKSTHNSAQILRMFPWARIPTWVSTATIVLSLSKADALLYWLDPIMVRAQYMFQQLFSSTFLGPYFCDSVNPLTYNGQLAVGVSS